MTEEMTTGLSAMNGRVRGQSGRFWLKCDLSTMGKKVKTEESSQIGNVGNIQKLV